MVKISLNTVTRECIADSNFLGFEGENQANVLDFSFSGEHIDGTAVLNIKRGKDTGFVAVDKVGNGYQLPVRSSLLSQVGDITFQFVITTPSGAIMKFDSFVMTVEDAIDTDVPLPEEYPSWIEMANYKLAEVDAAITRANSTSNQLLQDKENGVFDGKDGVDGKSGINGISPTVITEETATGTKITITDINGTHVAEILNGATGATGATGPMGPRGLTGPQGPQGPAGKDGTISFEELTEEQKATLKGDAGIDGKPGADGYSPTAKVSQTSTGATITITDKNGTTTANIVNGIDGKAGSSGADGQPGKDGLTPYIGENGNWWIGDTDTGVSAGGSGGGSSYREQELLSTPIVYSITNGRGWNNINANIDFVESVDNFDELSFVIELGNDNGYYHVRHHSIKVSDIIYNNSETTVYNGSHIQIPFGIQNIICNLAGWFKTGSRFWAVNIGTYNLADSAVAFPKVRLRSVKGIKY